MKYCAFISYRHTKPDQQIAKALHTAIETYGIPKSIQAKTGKKKMGKVFRDQEELPLTSDLSKDIETALDESEWFIAICSPRYLKSDWCLSEMAYFIKHKGRDHVLTILIEGEPKDSFPEMIRYRDETEKKEKEPLAANVRSRFLPGMLHKLRSEKLRLFAPMLGLEYDDLKRRARQRKIRMVSIVCAFALAAAAGIVTFLAVNHARQEALRLEALEQQRIAEEESQRAEQERLNAVSNNIGESLQKAILLKEDNNSRQAVALLLDTLSLSEENEDLRRDEIITRLRDTMYISPFSIISKLDLQNARLANATISPDGTKGICIANGNCVALIDLNSSTVLYTVSKDNSEISYIGFSPDGSRFVAICDEYRYVQVWNTEDGSEVLTYNSRTDRRDMVANVLFWQGSDTLLVQDYNEFYLVSLTDGEETLFYTMGEQQDGYRYDNNLYTVGLGKPVEEIMKSLSDDYLHCALKISQDGSKVLISGRDGSTGTIILNAAGERICLLDRLPATSAEYYDISPDGQYVSCQSMVGFLGVWETETGRMRYLKSMDRDFSASITAPVFSPDSERLAYISNGTLVIAEAKNGKELAQAELEYSEGVVPFLHWSNDGDFLFFFNPNLYFIDAKTAGTLLFRSSDISNMFNNAVPAGDDLVFVTRGGGEAVCYSLPGISSMVFRDYQGKTTGYDPLSDPTAAWEEAPVGEHQLTETFRTLTALTDYDPELYYSEDGNYAALIYADGTIEIFRKNENNQVYLMNAQFSSAPSAFGITGDTMVAADSYGRMMFQDLTDGDMIILNSDAGHMSFVFNDNLLMASQDNAMIIDVFDIKRAELLFSMCSSAPFREMAFSEDGKYAVAYTDDSCMTAELWPDEDVLLEKARSFAPGH